MCTLHMWKALNSYKFTCNCKVFTACFLKHSVMALIGCLTNQPFSFWQWHNLGCIQYVQEIGPTSLNCLFWEHCLVWEIPRHFQWYHRSCIRLVLLTLWNHGVNERGIKILTCLLQLAMYTCTGKYTKKSTVSNYFLFTFWLNKEFNNGPQSIINLNIF